MANYKTAAEATQALLDVTVFLLEYGRVECGTPEAEKVISAHRFFKKAHAVGEQRPFVRPNPTFVFFPRDDEDDDSWKNPPTKRR